MSIAIITQFILGKTQFITRKNSVYNSEKLSL